MTYKIILHRDALKELKKLPKSLKEKVHTTIEKLKSDPVPREAAKLKGRLHAYRIRIGDYRVVYEVHVTEIVIYVIGIAHRKEIYRRIIPRR